MFPNTFFKQALRTIQHESRGRTPQRFNRWFKWLAPGLLVKRWLLISAAGVLLTSLGLAIWVKLTPIFRLIEFTAGILEKITTIIPNYVSGPMAIICGLVLIFWGQTRTLGAITDVLMPGNEDALLDVLHASWCLLPFAWMLALVSTKHYKGSRPRRYPSGPFYRS